MKDYKAYFILNASPQEVYAALTQEATLQLWTGEPAVMPLKENEEFSLWGGSICGKNISFENGKKLVQQWYFGQQEPASMVTIKLHPHKKGTSVELHHTNIPIADYNDIVSGWEEVYFGSLSKFYE